MALMIVVSKAWPSAACRTTKPQPMQISSAV